MTSSTTKNADGTSKVISIESKKKAADRRASEKKWGVLAMKPGFSILPAILFRGQRRLGLSNQQLVLLLHLADHWWTVGDVPWPKKETLAQRMQMSDKQIQRIARQLEKGGFLQRETRMRAHGQTSNGYNLNGLVQKLNAIAPEFIEAREAAAKAEKPGRKLRSVD